MRQPRRAPTSPRIPRKRSGIAHYAVCQVEASVHFSAQLSKATLRGPRPLAYQHLGRGTLLCLLGAYWPVPASRCAESSPARERATTTLEYGPPLYFAFYVHEMTRLDDACPSRMGFDNAGESTAKEPHKHGFVGGGVHGSGWPPRCQAPQLVPDRLGEANVRCDPNSALPRVKVW
jgi:hypothetical protein